jgi:hypothetical protein
MTHLNSLAGLEMFDPERAVTVLEPEHAREDYWVGCPSVLYEPDRGRFLMTYRQRRPRGESVERGWRCAIAASDDGVTFEDIWAVEKHELNTSSMERFAVTYHHGRYLLYISYVDPVDSRWRIDVVEADTPEKFDVATARPVLTSAGTGTEGVKDPHPVRIGPSILLMASYAAPSAFSEDERARAHGNADIYTTGMTTFPTGVGISQDGLEFDWRPDALPVGRTWDRYQARLCTVVATGSGYIGLYDGSADADGNYEERTGVAVSADLMTWSSLTPQHPWATSPHATGSLRYADIVPVNDQWFMYFEYARADGAHELRLARLPRT